jgi:hypothetical protein
MAGPLGASTQRDLAQCSRRQRWLSLKLRRAAAELPQLHEPASQCATRTLKARGEILGVV